MGRGETPGDVCFTVEPKTVRFKKMTACLSKHGDVGFKRKCMYYKKYIFQKFPQTTNGFTVGVFLTMRLITAFMQMLSKQIFRKGVYESGS